MATTSEDELAIPKTGAQLRGDPEERENYPTLHRHQAQLKAPCLCAYWKVHELRR